MLTFDQVLLAADFAYLAYDALLPKIRTITQLLKTTNGFKVNAYLAAALLAFSVGPWTARVMISNNFALIKKNEDLGGSRSSASAEEERRQGIKPGQRSAKDSVESKGSASELRNLSGPMARTAKSPSEAEDQQVRDMLAKFGRQNVVRAFLLGGGGIIGLLATLAWAKSVGFMLDIDRPVPNQYFAPTWTYMLKSHTLIAPGPISQVVNPTTKSVAACVYFATVA
ncbi:hypothetical protein AC579_9580 [Pseudocercospora musae]|uniref:Uncharacterized protein n=1 Tax=Pseudocercospora musae TaxID=113226 RepID=A0A139ITN8_9PEZI|nr:hypothetical protein AC579_9580 [Pseudocercospora musae]